MIVVAIVGILAVLGIVGYRKIILAAHTSEATHMVQSIRVAEETYHAEAQTYVATSADGMTGLYPNATPTNTKMNWSTPTGACADPLVTQSVNCFALLPVHADGPVMYGYATVAGSAGSTVTSIKAGTVTLTGPTGKATTDWYWVTAVGNPSGVSGAVNSYVVGNSFANDLFVQDP